MFTRAIPERLRDEQLILTSCTNEAYFTSLLLLQMSRVAWSVCLSVCVKGIIRVSSAKTAEPIEMPFRG